MSKYIAPILFVISILYASASYADCSGNSCSNVYIDRLYVNTNGYIYVGTSGDETLLNCEAHAGVYTTILSNSADPGVDRIYSTLLAAQLANKKVKVRIHEESNGCRIAYVTLDRQ